MCYSWQLKWEQASAGFQRSQQKNNSQGGGFASDRFLAPPFCSTLMFGTSRPVLIRVPVGLSPGMNAPYSMAYIQVTWKTKERKRFHVKVRKVSIFHYIDLKLLHE